MLDISDVPVCASNSEVPGKVFAYELGCLIFLMVEALLAYTWFRPFFSAFSDLPIPLNVTWFGALGAVTVGLYGIFNHARTWSNDYRKWHWARPFTGAALAIASYVIFHTLIQAAATGTAVPISKTPNNAAFFYDSLAFLIGYSDKTFAQLLQRLTSVLLGPGQPHPPGNDPRDKTGEVIPQQPPGKASKQPS